MLTIKLISKQIKEAAYRKRSYAIFILSGYRFLVRVREKLKKSFHNISVYYEICIAPFVAKNLFFLYWPAYKLLKHFNFCFVVNLAGGAGNTLIELDNFFRKQYLGEIPLNRRYVLVRKSVGTAKACVKLFADKFWWIVANNFVYYLFLPITIRCKDITLDVGVSRLKWQLSDKLEAFPPADGQTYLQQISKADGLIQCNDYFRRRLKCPEYFPLRIKKVSNRGLIKLLNGNTKNIALIHVKNKVVNATAKITDPATYLAALTHLKNQGYQVVFVGREIMPEIFSSYGVINYARSSLASFENDLRLFSMAEVVITAGSGIAALADLAEKPLLYLNSWHLAAVMVSKMCIMVPTLVKSAAGEYLKFREQIKFYESMLDVGEESFRKLEGKYVASNATAEEILAALQELMMLKEKYQARSPLQERFMEIENQGWLRYSRARYSEYFLKQHVNLF